MKSAPRLLLALLLMWVCAISSFAQPGPTSSTTKATLRVLILTGDGNTRQTTPFLRQLLSSSGRFEARLCESPAGLSTTTFAPFDAVVVDCSAISLGDDTEKALATFVQSGKGLVVTHNALASLTDSKSGLAQLTKASLNAVTSSQTPFRLFELKNAKHPIMPEKTWRTADQPLRGLTLQTGTEILATSDKDDPLLFATAHGQGRIFGTALGRDLGSMQENAFVTTFLRGTEWAASGQVTLAADISLPGPSSNGVRLLIINGGHDHEASFYGLFDGYSDLGWAPVTDSTLAFKQDLRSKYDVLVFYNFARDLDDDGKKHLREFVESGKGIVVLHHGILNYQKWPWWYEEVVGGLYRLERQGSIPNSTVKFGEEHWITPATDHPITAGLAPFHVTDETYKGLFISPNIKPLLFTDNPTSDRTVAWIGPCTTSRVVFIQLGHDHSPYRHPSYRTLVHNSILWTAGKLK